MYKYLLFDLDDTLFNFSKGLKVALKKTFKNFNVKCTKENIELYSKINKKYWEKLERGEQTKQEILVNRFSEFFETINIKADAKKVNEMYLNTLALKAYYIKGAIKVLKALKKKGYKILLISNGNKHVQEGRLKSKKKILKYLDEIYLSDCIGYTKPDPGFVNYILENSKYNNINDTINKKEMIIIGDSLTSDMKLGETTGIDTIWFNPSNKAYKDYKPNYIISNLIDINKIL